jgi:hypothetical protein
MFAWRLRRLPLLVVLLSVILPAIARAQTKPAESDETFFLFSDDPWFPGLKSQDLFEGWTYTAGMEVRSRHMDERNRLRPAGETTRDIYHLTRFAPFVELKHENVTLYVQGIDAASFDHELPPVVIDVNRADLLQYYADFNLYDFENGSLRLKAGRQFLQYGSQHLVSNLAWGNTYRNFEGLKLYYSSEAWSIDAFVMKPVNGATVPSQLRPYSSDAPDSSQTFSGVYATLKQLPLGSLDLYWLWLYEDNDVPARLDGNRHTVGARYFGTAPLFDGKAVSANWDAEAAWQGGEDVVGAGPRESVSAAFMSVLAGVTLNEVPWTPNFAVCAFFGSGDDDPTDNDNNTFSTLYPLGHAYWGQIDNFNGSNLVDYGPQVTVKPTKRLSLATQYHFFEKDSTRDFVWNVAGASLGNLTTSERRLGQELDFVATMQFNKNLQMQAGYLWFWYDQAVSGNAGIPQRDDAQQFYLMTTWNF